MVLLNVSFPSALAAVPSSSSFREHFARSEAFTTTAVPTALDTTTHGQHSVLVKAASAAGCAFPNPPLLRSGVVQLLRLPWKKAAHVRSLAGLVESLLIGELVGWEATGASEVTSLWDGATGEWSARAADLVAGGTGAGIQLLQRLGGEAVRRTGESGGFVSEYLQDRHGFAAECTVAPCGSRPALLLSSRDLPADVHLVAARQSSPRASRPTLPSAPRPATPCSRWGASTRSRSPSRPTGRCRRSTRRCRTRRSTRARRGASWVRSRPATARLRGSR